MSIAAAHDLLPLPPAHRRFASFAESLRAERLAEREVDARAQLDAERRRVGEVVSDLISEPATRGRTTEAGVGAGVGIVDATIGEAPPARDDGRDGPAPDAARGYEMTIQGVRPTPAGALGLRLDQIG